MTKSLKNAPKNGRREGFRTGFDDYAVLFWGTTEIKIVPFCIVGCVYAFGYVTMCCSGKSFEYIKYNYEF